MTTFDLSPPTDAQRDRLVAGLSEDERRVVIRHLAHAASPVRRSSQSEAPTAGSGRLAPRRPRTHAM